MFQNVVIHMDYSNPLEVIIKKCNILIVVERGQVLSLM